MPTLQFLPWCPIEKSYTVGEITLHPFKRDRPLPYADDLSASYAKRVLAAYKDLAGHAVTDAAIIQYGTKGILDDLTEEEVEVTEELVDLACFSGLAIREHFGHSPYCNSENFDLYGQRFRDEPVHVALRSRRSTGHVLDGGYALAELVFSVPVHCNGTREIVLDESLLKALCDFRGRAAGEEWATWQNAISSFNLGNMDNSRSKHQVEWVLLASAFEHLLGASSTAVDVSTKFSAAFVPRQSLQVKDAERPFQRNPSPEASVRTAWMREFYSVRGDFAHGRARTLQPLTWSPMEHLSLARIAFPLLVRSLLYSKGGYPIPSAATAELNIFEKLASKKDFLVRPNDQKNSNDVWWHRLLRDEAWEDARAAFLADDKKDGE